MKTLIIGANGQIGKKVLNECAAMGMNIRAMVRSEEQFKALQEQGIEAVIGDLEGNITDAFKGCQRVIFTAGSGSKSSPHKTLLVDLWGSIRAIEESERQGIQHFIMVSSLKSDDPLRGPERIRHYLVARNRADDRLMRSKLNYTLLRPGRLTDEMATGKLSATVDWNDDTNANSLVTRDDVVEMVIASLNKSSHHKNEVIDFINGDIPMTDFLNMYFKQKVVA